MVMGQLVSLLTVISISGCRTAWCALNKGNEGVGIGQHT